MLQPRVGPGLVALRLIALDKKGLYTPQQEWWDSLLAAVVSRRNGELCRASDREEAALARISQAIPDLFASREAALPALNALQDRVGQLYLQQGLPFFKNLMPRNQAGVAP